MDPLEQYLSLTLSWDGADANTYKSVSWRFRGQDGRDHIAQAAANAWEPFLRLVRSRISFGVDVWVGVGTQKSYNAAKPATRDGFVKPDRTVGNIHTHRSLFADVDVGKPGAYATVQEAGEAIYAVCDAAGVWKPTAFVLSGSGIHAYWGLTESVPVERWRAMSEMLVRVCQLHQLRFDTQCSRNAAQILRPPGSFNYKSGQPKPVTLQMLGPTYTPDQMEQALAQQGSLRVVGGTTTQKLPPGPSKMKGGVNAAFGAGLNDSTAAPVDLESLADAGCGVMADALDTGGAAHAEPLWNLLVLAATFDPDPRERAHDVSYGHPGYTVEDTDRKFDEKIRAREQNPDIGWPTCNTFSGVHSACRTCPHFAAGKTPFHLAPKAGPNPTVSTIGSSDLPPGYRRLAGDRIWTTIQTEKKTIDVCVADYAILSASLRQDSHGIVLRAMVDSVKSASPVETYVDLSFVDFVTWQAMTPVLAKDGLTLNGPQRALFREFLVAWANKLQHMKHTRIKAMPLGWDDKDRFVFNSVAHSATGSSAVYHGPHRLAEYDVAGDLPTWQQAANMVMSQRSPELEAIIATSFAAPLIFLTGHTGVLVSAYSLDSGAGKTTALRVAQAVWGCPFRGVQALTDTDNSTFNRLVALKNLPLFWDELQKFSDMQTFVRMLFRLTLGRNKQRLNRASQAVPTQTFSTMMISCANTSVADGIASVMQDTQAGLVRCFEFAVPVITKPVDKHTVDAMIEKLRDHHGAAGEVYAKFLGANKDAVRKMVAATRGRLEKQLSLDTSERYLEVAAATMLVGAYIANHLKLTTFNMPALEQFLISVLLALRVDRARLISQPNSVAGATNIMSKLIADGRNKFMIMSDTVYGQGNPGKGKNVLHGPHDRITTAWAQYGVADFQLRVVAPDFREWLRAHHVSGDVVHTLMKRFNGVERRGAIGAGTDLFGAAAVARQRTIDFNLTSLFSNPGAPSP